MSGKLIGIIVAALVVIGGGAAYVIAQNKDDEKASTASNAKDVTKDPENSDMYKGDLLNITTAGKARTCTFSATVENVTSNGTLYTDGKGRGFMEIQVADVGSTNVLALSDKVYGWTTTGSSTTGFSYSKAELEKMASDAGANTQTGAAASSANQPFDMKCTTWKVDIAKFTVPTNINFMSLPSGQ